MTNEQPNEPTCREPRGRCSAARWETECRLMAKVFPQFQPFAEESCIGFRGKLQRPRTGQCYDVVLQAPMSDYPLRPPAAYLKPRPEPYCWDYGDRLSFLIRWVPNKNSFASVALVVLKYINEFDGSKEETPHVNSPEVTQGRTDREASRKTE